MSSGKRFEKTFSRNKKRKSNEKEEEEEVLITSLKSSSQSHQQKNGQPPTTIIYALMSTNNNSIKKKKDEIQKLKTKGKLIEVKKPKKTINKEKERKEKDNEGCECAFPTTRILRIVKSEGPSDYKLSGEAVFLINKATEKFIELFTKDAYDAAVEAHKSFVAYKHLSSVICKEKRMDFLSDFVPEKVTAEKALAEIKQSETLPDYAKT